MDTPASSTSSAPLRTQRLFVAIALPEPLHDAIGRLQARFRREGVSAGLVPPANLHLSLQFLGDVPVPVVPALCDELAEIAAGAVPFALTVGPLGRFGPPSSPRVIWLGTSEPDVLGALALAVHDAAVRLAIPLDDRPFRPHITLARVRHAHQRAPMRHALAVVDIPDFGDFPVDAFDLVRSHLTPQGARHTTEARFRLSRRDRGQ